MAVMHDPALLTHVDLTWIEKKKEQWIRFGRIASERIVDRKSKVVMFRAGAVFALVDWASNGHGTVHSEISILRAVTQNEAFTTHPNIRPGAEILLQISGWPKVLSVLEAIDAVEAADIEPADASPDHWRHVANRLAAGSAYRPYSRARHDAWIRRKALEA